MLRIITGLMVVVLAGCSAVTIRTDDKKETSRLPDYQQTFSYYALGLSGEHEVNVREICGARKVEQMQAVSSPLDVLVGVATLGIYVPRTARVWCEEEQP